MNKQLIITYFEEFKHWLNGGKLLSKHPDEFNWYLVTTVLWNCPKMQYIINDEYVEFRKALAEGKIVQEQDYYSKQWVDMKTPDFHGASDTQYEGVYRIKPEEPKFKIGDWVCFNNKVMKVSDGTSPIGLIALNNDGNAYMSKDLSLWQPKVGELVILKDKNGIISIIKYNGETDVYPFIGEITWLHKKD